jgi:hypothetical protein
MANAWLSRSTLFLWDLEKIRGANTDNLLRRCEGVGEGQPAFARAKSTPTGTDSEFLGSLQTPSTEYVSC